MKNISLIVNVVLFVAVIMLYVDRFTGKSKCDKPTDKVEKSTGSASSIVFVRVDSLVSHYDLYNEQKKQLMQKQERLEGELNSKSKAFEREAMEFQEKVQKHLITSKEAEALQGQLAAKEQQLYQLKNQLQGELGQDEQGMLKRMNDSIISFLNDYNKTKKYQFILSSATVLHGEPALDITSDVLGGLNKRYNGK